MDLLVLGVIVLAFTVELWLGLLALVLAWFGKDALAVALLAPLFGVDRVRGALWGGLVLEPPPGGSAPSPPEELRGRTAEVVTDLDPEGEVAIGDERYPARSDGEPLSSGTAVRIVEIRLGRVIAEPESGGR